MRLSEAIFLVVSFFLSNLNATTTTLQNDTSEKNQKIVDSLSSRIETLSRAEIIKLSRAYSVLNQHLLAIKTLNIGLSKKPTDFEVLTLRGEQEILADKPNEALSTLKSSLELNPKYEPAFLLIVQIYEKRKNRYELRLVYQDMVQKLGEKELYLEKLCEITALDGLYDLSLEYCRKGVAKFSRSDVFPNFLGVTLMETGKSTEADGVFKKAATQFPLSQLIHITYADYLIKRKDFVLAYNYYTTASLVDEKNYDAQIGLARAALEIQKYQESIDAFRAACNLKKEATVEIRKAQAQLKIQKKTQVEQDFKKLLDSCFK